MIISSDYSLGGRIMDIASWHKVISSVRTDSRVFVENTESVITGKDNTGRDKISIICSKETSEKITADIYNEILGLEKGDISIYLTGINKPVSGLPQVFNEYQEITDKKQITSFNYKQQETGTYEIEDVLDQSETEALKDISTFYNHSNNRSNNRSIDSSDNSSMNKSGKGSENNNTEGPNNNLNNTYHGKIGPDKINQNKSENNCLKINEKGKNLMSQKKERLKAVYVIVEKGFSEDVIEAGEKAGTGGATIIPAEGNRSAANYVAPGLIINPHKEIVLIITEKEKAETLFEILSEEDGVLYKGKGIAYMTDIEKAEGLKKEK